MSTHTPSLHTGSGWRLRLRVFILSAERLRGEDVVALTVDGPSVQSRRSSMAHDPAPSTPNRPAYRPLEIGNNGGQYAYGSDGDDSGTPGSPAKRGGRTLWTKYDDDDGDDDASGSGESVVTQVTSATPAAAPAYGSGAQGRLRRGGSGRGAGGGGGGGGSFSFTSFLCCVRPDEDERYPHQVRVDHLDGSDGFRTRRTNRRPSRAPLAVPWSAPAADCFFWFFFF